LFSFSDYTGEDDNYFYRMNVCNPVNFQNKCANALVCQFQKQKHDEVVARICSFDGFSTPQFSLLGNKIYTYI
jgi:hypothetical protein